MKRFIFIPVILFGSFAAFIVAWIGAFMLLDHFGFNNQATPYYGFVSGVGPMLLTALGMSTIITGLWHTINCHADGCWRLGRHKISGTPWCNLHQDQARFTHSTEELLELVIEELRRTNEKADTTSN